MIPEILKLRKFEGIRAAYGVDEKTFDYRDYPQEGLIAIVGDNGDAKSTMQNNMQPFRIMPDRIRKGEYSTTAFNFYDECYGNDAIKDLYWFHDGIHYRSLLNIDADKRKQEAYLYILGDLGYAAVKATEDGKLEPYDREIEKILGSPQLYFTSQFRSQKAKQLSGYSRKEMEEIFSELLNLSPIQEKEYFAGYIASELTDRRTVTAKELSGLEVIIAVEPAKQKEAAECNKVISELEAAISSAEAEILTEETKLRNIDVQISRSIETEPKRTQLTADISAIGAYLVQLRQALSDKKTLYAEKQQTAESKLSQTKGLALKVVGLRTKQTEETKLTGLLEIARKTQKEVDALCAAEKALQAKAEKKRLETETAIADKTKTLESLNISRQNKKEYYNEKYKTAELKRRQGEAIAIKLPDLKKKAGEESAILKNIETAKTGIADLEVKVKALNAELIAIGAVETKIAEKETELQGCRLQWQSAIDSIKEKIRNTEDLVESLAEAKCANSEYAASCKFIKNAVAARSNLPQLRQKFNQAEKPDPREAAIGKEIAVLKESLSSKEVTTQSLAATEKSKTETAVTLKNLEISLSEVRTALVELPLAEEAGKQLPEIEAEIKTTLSEGKTALAEIDIQLAQLTTEIKKLQNELPEEKKASELETKKVTSDKKVSGLETSLTELSTALKELPLAEEAEKQLPVVAKELAAITEEYKTIVRELEAQIVKAGQEEANLQKTLTDLPENKDLIAQKVKVEQAIAAFRKSIETKREELTKQNVSIGTILEALKQIEETKIKADKLRDSLQKLDTEISEWKLLAKGLDTIVTLEIDDAGPSVSSIANKFLKCYGGRWSVSVRTQGLLLNGTGGVKDDFDIMVIDGLRDNKKSLSKVSGGEGNFIDSALTDAIALFNVERRGIQFGAKFTDEKDAALTVSNRSAFFESKRLALELGNSDVEWFISHSPEAMKYADAVFTMRDQ